MNSLFPAKMIHLDLADGPSGTPLETGGTAAYIVFWWRGIPLGHQQIPGDAFPLPDAHLWHLASQTVATTVGDYVLKHGFEAPLPEYPRASALSSPPDLPTLLALENPLRALDGQQPMTRVSDISVIVCTRDRAESLQRCLESLLYCAPSAEEILVVDNCPSCDATRRLVERYPEVQYVLEPQPGLDTARNTGIRRSRGQIVAFADDDVTVHPDWVARLAGCFSDSQVMAATGLVLAAELETQAQGLFEQHWGFNRGYRVLTYDSQYFAKLKPWGVPTWHVGAGANMAFRREAFDLIGNFDERLDVGAAGCSGDSEFWYRLLAAGLICRYDPRVIAFHCHREDMAALKRQLYFYLRGHTAALLIQFAKHKHWGNLFRLFLVLPLRYARLIVQGFLLGFQPRHRLIPVECAGCLSGILFFLRNVRAAKSSHADGSSL